MNKLTLLASLSVCSLCLGLAGCTGDDQPNNAIPQSTGTNGNNPPPRCMVPSFPPSGITLMPEDGSGPVRIVISASDSYLLLFQPNADAENGTYSYTPSGDLATLILTPNTGGATRTVDFVITSSTQGTYTSDSLGKGTFTLDTPLVGACGPY